MEVFEMLSIERCFRRASAAEESKTTTIAYGERVYHYFYKFAVVKRSTGTRPLYYCTLVTTSKIKWRTLNILRSRINTYRGRGATTVSKHVVDHAIVYSERVPPEKFPEEQKLTMDPLRVVMEKGTLPPTPRIDLALLYPISKDTKVSYVGDMDPISRRKLVQYQKEVSERYDASWVDNLGPLNYHLQLDNGKD